MRTGDLPMGLCYGKADLFEVAGKNRKQIRTAVDMCRRCPALDPCRNDRIGTPGMVRAGVVWTARGVSHQPERYIRNHRLSERDWP